MMANGGLGNQGTCEEENICDANNMQGEHLFELQTGYRIATDLPYYPSFKGNVSGKGISFKFVKRLFRLINGKTKRTADRTT
jgi:hypothetical protein